MSDDINLRDRELSISADAIEANVLYSGEVIFTAAKVHGRWIHRGDPGWWIIEQACRDAGLDHDARVDAHRMHHNIAGIA